MLPSRHMGVGINPCTGIMARSALLGRIYPIYIPRLGKRGLQGATMVRRSSIHSQRGFGRLSGRNAAAATGVSLAISLLAASGAQAQNCTVAQNDPLLNLGAVGASPAGVSSV